MEALHDSDCEILEQEIETITVFDSEDEENAHKDENIYSLRNKSDDFTITFQNEKSAKKLAEPMRKALQHVTGDLLFTICSLNGATIYMKAYAPTQCRKSDGFKNCKRFFNTLKSYFIGTGKSYNQIENFGTIQINVYFILMSLVILYSMYTFSPWLFALSGELLHFSFEFLSKFFVRILIVLGMMLLLVILSMILHDKPPEVKLIVTFLLAIFTLCMFWPWIGTFIGGFYNFSCQYLKSLSLRGVYLIVLVYIYILLYRSKNILVMFIMFLISFPGFKDILTEFLNDVLGLLSIFFNEFLARSCIVLGMVILFLMSFKCSISRESENFSGIIVFFITLFKFWSWLVTFILDLYGYFCQFLKSLGLQLLLLVVLAYTLNYVFKNTSQKFIVSSIFSILVSSKIFSLIFCKRSFIFDNDPNVLVLSVLLPLSCFVIFQFLKYKTVKFVSTFVFFALITLGSIEVAFSKEQIN